MNSSVFPGRDTAGCTSLADSAALVTRLHYDRADIAFIAPAAAQAMDLVIEMVGEALKNRCADGAREPDQTVGAT